MKEEQRSNGEGYRDPTADAAVKQMKAGKRKREERQNETNKKNTT